MSAWNSIRDQIQHPSQITTDNRKIKKGSFFFAIQGSANDGHRYIQNALDAGAERVIVQRGNAHLATSQKDHRIVEVTDTRIAYASAAAHVYGYPARKLKIFGVTGTNGKTTTTWLLESILNHCGEKTGLVGTVENRIGSHKILSTHTTPDALELHRIFSEFVQHGATAVAMEVSSHALEQKRTAEVAFAGAVFTNLTQDHLDYHQSMENYFLAKARLFQDHDVAIALVHSEDSWGQKLQTMLHGRHDLFTFGKSRAHFDYSDLKISAEGIRGEIHSAHGKIQVHSSLLASFNAQNIAGAASIALASGYAAEKISRGIEAVTSVPGRLERVQNSKERFIVVDYAHTPDALEKALRALRPLCIGKLVCVFGCGGDRDATKRPLMAKVAQENADLVIATSDNPRTEDPEKILSEIFSGFKSPKTVLKELDRAKAIEVALRKSSNADCVLIAGKGHEDYQILSDAQGGTRKIFFDDRVIAREICEKI